MREIGEALQRTLAGDLLVARRRHGSRHRAGAVANSSRAIAFRQLATAASGRRRSTPVPVFGDVPLCFAPWPP